EFVPGLTELTAACHRAGPGKVFLQISHFLKISRSGWRQTIGDLTVDELEALPSLFAAAAERAATAGFDGVELHMAHAYTLSSMLSRMNRRRDHYGRTLENRLRLPSMVLRRVRDRMGAFPVAVRFDADESIRKGYSVNDAAAFAVRFAELGATYISLSAGGKFEDAVHREGEPLYPYTGYSGDRCMPGDGYPDAANIWMAEAVRGHLRRAGHDTPVLGTGKIGSIELANSVLERGACDMVGMARALLADPDLPLKSGDGRQHEIVSCIYCNVCKSLDESFKTVVCYLWPKGSIQAPGPGEAAKAAIIWPAGSPALSSRSAPGEVRLRWATPTGHPAGYDVLRSVDGAPFARLTSCTRTRHLDDTALRNRSLRYRVVPYDSSGRRGVPSNVVEAVLEEAPL
ncbi:MAG: NADH:flavin oxidoreductase, partial [Acidimicrobiales bacterium]